MSTHGTQDTHDGGPDHVPHLVPLGTYFGVWVALLMLTALTVGVSYLNFGEWNVVIALLVATIKAGLVAAIFMHLVYDKGMNGIIFGSSIIFLAVLIAFTSFDLFGRGKADKEEAEHVANVANPFGPAPAARGVPAQVRAR